MVVLGLRVQIQDHNPAQSYNLVSVQEVDLISPFFFKSNQPNQNKNKMKL